MKKLSMGKNKVYNGYMDQLKQAGFTLVELLVVIMIIIILATVGLVVYQDLAAEARDATRVNDMAEIVSAVQLATHDAINPALALCSGTTAPCSGDTFPVTSSTRNTDGTGWILVNFDAINVVTFNQLPLDPLNNSTYHYVYQSDGTNWRVSVPLESARYKVKMSQDGGPNDNLYEVGVGIRRF